MKIIFLVSIILLLILIPLPINAAVTQTINYWENQDYLLNNTDIAKNINEIIKESNEIPKIKYEINLDRNEHRRIIGGGLYVETDIDVKQNLAIDKFEIDFYVDNVMNPNLIGESILFEILGQDFVKDMGIVAVNAPGWEITSWDQYAVMLTNLENEIFGNKIFIWVAIKNQSNFKGREFFIKNRHILDFESKIKINEDYKFTQFSPNLWEPYTESEIISQQVINNKINFFALLYNVKERFIEFDYSYDYQEDINAKIVEENRKSTNQTLEQIKEESRNSTNLALKLFGISIIISILSFIISFYEKLKSIINWIKSKGSN